MHGSAVPVFGSVFRRFTEPETPTTALDPRLGAVLDALPDAVLVTDAAGLARWTNGRFDELFGGTSASMRGRSVDVLAGPYSERTEGRQLVELAKNGEGQADLTLFRRDGLPFPAVVRVRPLDSRDERLAVMTITDNTDLHRLRTDLVLKAESAVREREVLRATCEVLEDPAIVVDETERLVLANQAARKLFTLGGNEIHGRSLMELPLPAVIRGAWLTFLSGGRGTLVQTSRVTIGGEAHTFLLRLARARSQHGAPLASVLVLRDLTRFTEPDRRKYDFIAEVSHELRTPLASIQGFVATLLAEPGLEPDVRQEFCRIISDESQRLGRLVEDLLELAQLDAGRVVLERQTVDATALALEIAAGLGERARTTGSPIDASAPEEPVLVLGDAARLKTALTQLVENAIAHGASSHGIRFDLRTTSDGASAIFEIRDWGRGVPPEDIERIFDPFYRVLGDGASGFSTSTGTGLALCRQVIERHGGDVRAELPGGGGLRVVVTLPVA